MIKQSQIAGRNFGTTWITVQRCVCGHLPKSHNRGSKCLVCNCKKVIIQKSESAKQG